MRTRKLGTITLGVSLVTFGVLFLVSKMTHFITYRIIMYLWPCILIFLGLEIVLSYVFNKSETVKYDGCAFFLIIALTLFAVGISGADFLMSHVNELHF
ncbi:MAG: DUF5668 domain-containing protein [Clostridia bacterium]